MAYPIKPSTTMFLAFMVILSTTICIDIASASASDALSLTATTTPLPTNTPRPTFTPSASPEIAGEATPDEAGVSGDGVESSDDNPPYQQLTEWEENIPTTQQKGVSRDGRLSDFEAFLAIAAIMLSVTFIGLPLIMNLEGVTPSLPFLNLIAFLSFVELIGFIGILLYFLIIQTRWMLLGVSLGLILPTLLSVWLMGNLVINAVRARADRRSVEDFVTRLTLNRVMRFIDGRRDEDEDED